MAILLLTAWQAEMPESQPTPAAPPGERGTLEGWVRLAGNALPQPTPVENTTDPKVCGRAQTLEDILVSANTRGIQNAIVALKGLPASKIPANPPGHLVLDNRECKFTPHVSVLTVGSVIQVLNSDPTLHNAHFYGVLAANVALPFQGAQAIRRVGKPGMIIVKCDVHGWMQAFIRVDSHPFHAVTDEDGHFLIPSIPAGAHSVEIWHERLGPVQRTIHIKPAQTEAIEVEYSLEGH